MLFKDLQLANIYVIEFVSFVSKFPKLIVVKEVQSINKEAKLYPDNILKSKLLKSILVTFEHERK